MLKKKKRVMKLSMTALVSMMTVYGGTALCSVGAMTNTEDIGESIKMQMTENQEISDVEQPVDYLPWQQDTREDIVAETLVLGEAVFVCERADELYWAVDRRDIDRARKLLDKSNFSDVNVVWKRAQQEYKEDKFDFIKQIYELYMAGLSFDEKFAKLLQSASDDVIHVVMKLAFEEGTDYIADTLNQMMLVLFCEKHGGYCDLSKGYMNLSSQSKDSKLYAEFADDLAASMNNATIVNLLLECNRIDVNAANKFQQKPVDMVMDKSSLVFTLIKDRMK